MVNLFLGRDDEIGYRPYFRLFFDLVRGALSASHIMRPPDARNMRTRRGPFAATEIFAYVHTSGALVALHRIDSQRVTTKQFAIDEIFAGYNSQQSRSIDL